MNFHFHYTFNQPQTETYVGVDKYIIKLKFHFVGVFKQ
jgi:hypothetical protein